LRQQEIDGEIRSAVGGGCVVGAGVDRAFFNRSRRKALARRTRSAPASTRTPVPRNPIRCRRGRWPRLPQPAATRSACAPDAVGALVTRAAALRRASSPRRDVVGLTSKVGNAGHLSLIDRDEGVLDIVKRLRFSARKRADRSAWPAIGAFWVGFWTPGGR